MAREPRKSNIEQMIDASDGVDASVDETIEQQQTNERPSWKRFPESKIPISKSAGPLWKSRRDTGIAKMKSSKSTDAWDEAIAYYKNDQTNKRNRSDPDNPSPGNDRSLSGDGFGRTENVVFANVSALVPSIYAKNPDVSVHSPKGDEDRPFAIACQKLIRTLMQKRTAPGINLKPKMRRGVVLTTLTNISYIEVGYTRRENAVEGTLQEIDAIAAKLEKARDPKEVEELEGQLMALDEKVDLLHPAGPWSRIINPKDVVVDPDASMPDLSDAKWVMIKDVMETSFLNAVYREKNEEGKYTNIYNPSAVLKSNADGSNIAGHDLELSNFSILTGEEHSHRQFGYDNEETFKRAQRTFVWKVWDRITRRVYMYADNDWTFPIWVWDDPYGLDDFFPLFPIAFHTDPEDMYARGEVSYYLDQQDEINLINSQVARMRHRISNTLVYNKRAVQDERSLMAITAPTKSNNLVGVDIPENMKIGDMLSAPPVPAVEYAQLFDKRNLFESIDRVSGVSSVVKGVEFKTNTTNKAIDSYESSTAMRLDEKIDAIEEVVGRIGHALIVMCLQFMSREEVVQLIGMENAQAWPEQMTAQEANRRFTLTVTGGSSLKPTSKVRKEQAQQNAQIIGQFGASNPIAFLVVLKMFQRAFSDELTLEPSDWDMIIQSAEGMLQQPQGGQGDEQQGGQQPQQQQPQQGQQGGINPEEILGRISEGIQRMPDELRAKIGEDIAQGVPLTDIVAKLMQIMNNTQQE